jgi:hypothetical protein
MKKHHQRQKDSSEAHQVRHQAQASRMILHLDLNIDFQDTQHLPGLLQPEQLYLQHQRRV